MPGRDRNPEDFLLGLTWGPCCSAREAPAQFAGLVASVKRQIRKGYHPDLGGVKRHTLADANEPRPALIFAKTYGKRCERLGARLSKTCTSSRKIS
jgi:hypothetical protein